MNLPAHRLMSGLMLSILLLCCTQALAFNPAPAEPAKAVFYPDEIEISVEGQQRLEELPAGGTGFLLALPAWVKPESFLVSVNGVSAGGYYWLDKDDRDALFARARKLPAPGKGTLPENEPSPERRALLEKLIPLDEEVAAKEGALAAAQARIDLWEKSLERYGQGGGGPVLNLPSLADEAVKLSEAYVQQIPGLYLERDKVQRALEDVRVRQAKAEKALEEFDHKEDCLVVAVPFSSPAKGTVEATLRYSYAIPGSCDLSYRLGAFPDKGEIVVDQDASLTQHSGFAWTNVEVFVSTIRRDRTLQPTNIRPWTISLRDKRPPAMPAPAARMMEAEELKAPPVQSAMAGDSRKRQADDFAENRTYAPVAEERGTFRLWNLGKRRIENKTPVTLALTSDTYKASFLYTIRPLSNPKGFLTASLSLPEALELPPGLAQFSVDGAAVGSRQFSFNGDRGEIFFGSDPQVTAVMRDLRQSGGEQGFFSREQTLLWHWQITLRNTRSKAAQVVLEDPAPVATDNAITVKATSTPKPETVVNAPEHGGATIYRWQASLKPGEPLVIEHKVEISAPSGQDKVIDPGFRRR
ncbi:MAG: DUF4139 domain-containing protein [Desulfovibrionaceae bacterium]|nr:DUF4139 domain-containing protein [Desulfovibrionaceae bacterium]